MLSSEELLKVKLNRKIDLKHSTKYCTPLKIIGGASAPAATPVVLLVAIRVILITTIVVI